MLVIELISLFVRVHFRCSNRLEIGALLIKLANFREVPHETVLKAPIGFELKPQKPTEWVEEALFHYWRPEIRRLYTPL